MHPQVTNASPSSQLWWRCKTELSRKYQLEEQLHESDTGFLYRAHLRADPDQWVALRVFRVDRGGLSTASVLGKLEQTHAIPHPNLAALLDFGALSEDIFFVAHAWTTGLHLTRWISQRGLPAVDTLVRLAAQVCGALQILHQQVAHENLEVSNVILRASGNGTTAYIVSSGLPGDCKRSSGSPEAKHADIESLGRILFFMATGLQVEACDVPDAQRVGHDIQKINPDVPLKIATILAETFCESARQKARSADELRTALEEALIEHLARAASFGMDSRRSRMRSGEQLQSKHNMRGLPTRAVSYEETSMYEKASGSSGDSPVGLVEGGAQSLRPTFRPHAFDSTYYFRSDEVTQDTLKSQTVVSEPPGQTRFAPYAEGPVVTIDSTPPDSSAASASADRSAASAPQNSPAASPPDIPAASSTSNSPAASASADEPGASPPYRPQESQIDPDARLLHTDRERDHLFSLTPTPQARWRTWALLIAMVIASALCVMLLR